MDISILSCPHCNAMVLSDAGRCHVCDYVFDQSQAEPEPIPALPTDDAVAEDLETCESCGETYRSGLVRCWNCGAFTRKEIEDAYGRMTSDPDRYIARIYREDQNQTLAPESTRRAGPWTTAALSNENSGSPPNTDEADATDDDFSFELADSVSLTDAAEAPAFDEPSGYELAVAPGLVEEPSSASEIPVAQEAAAATPAVEIPLLEAASENAATPETPIKDRKVAQSVPDVAHSEATAGDVLLQIAQAEEQDIASTRKSISQKMRGGFVVYCPMGCRVRVQERHRGKAGRCPKCSAVFFVPRAKAKPKPTAAVAAAETSAPAPTATEHWQSYLNDIHLHHVVPQKLRIKPDSLLNDFQTMDVVFSADGLLLISLVGSAGFMGANLKKKPALRTAVQEFLKTSKTAEGIPAAASRWIPTAELSQIAMAQPSPADVESLFGNIPVFGNGRIAVRLPRVAEATETDYLSFSLSEFRAFSTALENVCGSAGLGANTEVPLTETYNSVPCHYSDAPVRELLGIEYYQKDPTLKLQISGWRCGGCALVVSEDSRKKEKIGGANGKGIATAKCPKCQAKYGNHPLYELAPAPSA